MTDGVTSLRDRFGPEDLEPLLRKHGVRGLHRSGARHRPRAHYRAGLALVRPGALHVRLRLAGLPARDHYGAALELVRAAVPERDHETVLSGTAIRTHGLKVT
jgi:hypothetical protein